MAAPILNPAGGNEVMFFILDGTGRDGLRFLAMSTMAFPEICGYPDSGTLNAITGAGPDDVRRPARHGESLDSWDGHA